MIREASTGRPAKASGGTVPLRARLSAAGGECYAPRGFVRLSSVRPPRGSRRGPGARAPKGRRRGPPALPVHGAAAPMTLLHVLLAAPAAHSTLTALDWVMIGLYFSVLAGVA